MAGESTVIVQLQLQGAQVFAAEARTAGTALGSVDDGAKKAEKGGKRMGGMMAMAGPAMATAGAAAGALAVKVGFDAVKAFEEARKVGAQTRAVIRSTGGAANVTAGQVGALSGKISKYTGVDDEAIQSASNLILTFKDVRNEAGKGNDIFNQTTKAAVDMGAALGTDPKQAAMQLGKALNDPAKGMTRLQRSGVTFTAQQEKNIKALQRQGKTMQAQKIILREVNSEFGGSARAQATPLDKIRVAAGNLQEALGGKLMGAINSVIRGIQRFAASKSGQAVMRQLGAAARDLRKGFAAAAPYIRNVFIPALKVLGGAVLIAVIAVIRTTARSLRLLWTVLGAVGRAIGPLQPKINQMVAAWRNGTGPIGQAKSILEGIATAAKDVVNWIGEMIGKVGELAGKFGDLGGAITSAVGQLPGGGIASALMDKLAMGGYAGGGTTLVGERGPEIARFPRGTEIRPMAAGTTPQGLGDGLIQTVVQIDGREVARATSTQLANQAARR